MARLSPFMILFAMLIISLVGCRPKKEEGNEMATRKECNKPSFACYEKCAQRGASRTCSGCCADQRYLCDTGQKPSWDYCDSAQ